MNYLAKYYQDQCCFKAINYSYLAIDCCQRQNQNLDVQEFIRYFK